MPLTLLRRRAPRKLEPTPEPPQLPTGKLTPKRQLQEAARQMWGRIQQRHTLPAPLTILLGGRSPLDLVLAKIDELSEEDAVKMIQEIRAFGSGFDISEYEP